MTSENLNMRKHMYFIGVSTRQSSIMKVFPLWMKELGMPYLSLEGMDLKLNDDPANYRRAVTQIKEDPRCLGSLVTAHKINLLKAARDLFDYLDPLAQLTEEISCISKRGVRLEGYAKDPIAGGMSLDTLLGPGYFGRTGGHVLSLGAGGSTTALVLHFSRKQQAGDRPARMVIVNRSPGRIEALRRMADAVAPEIQFEYYCQHDPRQNDQLMETLPPGSGDQRDGHGQGFARIADYRCRPLPAQRGSLGAELPRRTPVLEPSAGAARGAQPHRRRRLVVLLARLDTGDCTGVGHPAR